MPKEQDDTMSVASCHFYTQDNFREQKISFLICKSVYNPNSILHAKNTDI